MNNKNKEIILNIRPEDIQICKNNESKCRGCIKSIIYWGNCQILKISKNFTVVNPYIIINPTENWSFFQ